MALIAVHAISEVASRLGDFLGPVDRASLIGTHPMFKHVHVNREGHVMRVRNDMDVVTLARTVQRQKPRLKTLHVIVSVDVDDRIFDQLRDAYPDGVSVTLSASGAGLRAVQRWCSREVPSKNWSVEIMVNNSDESSQVAQQIFRDGCVRVKALEIMEGATWVDFTEPRDVGVMVWYESWSKKWAPMPWVHTQDCAYVFRYGRVHLFQDADAMQHVTILVDMADHLFRPAYMDAIVRSTRLRMVKIARWSATQMLIGAPGALEELFDAISPRGGLVYFESRAVEEPAIVTLIAMALQRADRRAFEKRPCGCLRMAIGIRAGGTPAQMVCARLASRHLSHLAGFVIVPHFFSEYYHSCLCMVMLPDPPDIEPYGRLLEELKRVGGTAMALMWKQFLGDAS